MTFRYSPTLGEHTATCVTTPVEGVELEWEIPLHVSRIIPASMSGPQEGGVEPDLGGARIVCRHVYIPGGVVTTQRDGINDEGIFEWLENEYPPSEGDVESAIETWLSEDEATCYGQYHQHRGGDI